MTKRHLVIATRESPLAIVQANIIKNLLLKIHPELSIELLGITTEADKRLEVNLIEIGGKGLFVKELETALLEGKADIAVHSMKDMPMELPPGLILPVISEREDPRDAFISPRFASLSELPTGAIVGTSSLRRQTQIRAKRPDLILKNLRGNVQTRLKKLDDQEYDGIILAGSGLKRLDLSHRIRSHLSVDESLPAAGQGALGIECREDDKKVIDLIAPLNNVNSYACVSAERVVCRLLQGGCQVPIAAYAHIHHEMMTLNALVSNRDGTRMVRAMGQEKLQHAVSLGERVTKELIQKGAEKILKEFKV